MAKHVRHSVAYRRKREGKTDYKRRLGLLVSTTPRLVVRKSNANMMIQVVTYLADGDKVLASVSSTVLAKRYGYNLHRANIPSAYLTGLIAGKMAQKVGVKHAILDIGLQTSVKGSRLYAAAKGAIDAGLQIDLNKEIIPTPDMIAGKNIVSYSSKLEKEDKAKHAKVFSAYLKKGIVIKDVPKIVEETKQKIMKG